MNKGRIENLKNFKKGQSGNPAGRKPDVLSKELKHLTKEEFEEVANIIIKGDVHTLQSYIARKDISVLQLMIARTCLRISAKGDMGGLDALLNRMIGRVKESVYHTSDGSLAPASTVIVNIPDNGRQIRKPDGTTKPT